TALVGSIAMSAQAQPDDRVPGPFASGDGQVIAQGADLFRLVERPSPLPTGALRVNRERQRGGSTGELFARLAPAVVFILTENASGTGFLIDTEGRVLTNHHVVAEPLLDNDTGAQRVQVNLGVLDPTDYTMKVLKGGVTALVYKKDPVKDLALLKL